MQARVPQAFAPRAQEEGRDRGLLLESIPWNPRRARSAPEISRGFPVERAPITSTPPIATPCRENLVAEW